MATRPARTQATPTRMWKRTTARKPGSVEGTGTPNTMVVSSGMRSSLSHRLLQIGATSLGCRAIVAHPPLQQARYPKNAFEACRDRAGIDLIEDMAAFLARPDDLRSGKLLQVARNNRAILRQAGGDRSDVATAQ